MRRRTVILGLSGLALGALPLGARVAPVPAGRSLEAIRGEWRRFVPSGAEVTLSTQPLELAPQVWRERLTDAQYVVLREAGTEKPFTSALNEEKRVGLYVCRGCDLPLFTSEMKYDSGTGWPSFFTHIPEHFATKRDFKLIWPRTEYHCVRCGGHHGHVFDDGPPPTGERWCNNGVALRFIPL
ncbi:MAG: peptide-methionine (R)-S-oxide reductase MsrB [Gammaproteobacteria bacterium]|nr:peptide-methionine (R)-S-oxide reductase MsrB [Gammaproteobacteria bacterium]